MLIIDLLDSILLIDICINQSLGLPPFFFFYFAKNLLGYYKIQVVLR